MSSPVCASSPTCRSSITRAACTRGSHSPIATEIDPEILIIDEALGVGDAAFQERAKERIFNLLGRSHAVILVSHDMSSLRELCTRGIWLRQGRIEADGPIETIIEQYLASTQVQKAG